MNVDDLDGELEKLTLDELLELNRRIVKRVEHLHSLKTRANLERFGPGDRVTFQSDGRPVEGEVVRVNRKSVSVLTHDAYWRLHPHFLTKLPGDASALPEDIRKLVLGEK